MERAAVDPAAERCSDDQRHRRAPSVVILCGDFGDLIEGAGNKIRKLHLDHRTQPIMAAPIAAPTKP